MSIGPHVHVYDLATRVCACGMRMEWAVDGLVDDVPGGLLDRAKQASAKRRPLAKVPPRS